MTQTNKTARPHSSLGVSKHYQTRHCTLLSSHGALQCCSAAVHCCHNLHRYRWAGDGREVSNYNWISVTAWYYSEDTGNYILNPNWTYKKSPIQDLVPCYFGSKLLPFPYLSLVGSSSLLSSYHCMTTSSSYNFLHTRMECSRLSTYLLVEALETLVKGRVCNTTQSRKKTSSSAAPLPSVDTIQPQPPQKPQLV